MTHFEYEITKHSAVEFSKLVYFCSDQGECNMEDLPSDQTGISGPARHAKGENHAREARLLSQKDDENREQNAREGEHDFREPHKDFIDPAAEVAGDGTDEKSDEE